MRARQTEVHHELWTRLLRFTPWLIAPVFLIVRLAIAALITMFPLVVPGNAQFWVPDASKSLARSFLVKVTGTRDEAIALAHERIHNSAETAEAEDKRLRLSALPGAAFGSGGRLSE